MVKSVAYHHPIQKLKCLRGLKRLAGIFQSILSLENLFPKVLTLAETLSAITLLVFPAPELVSQIPTSFNKH